MYIYNAALEFLTVQISETLITKNIHKQKHFLCINFLTSSYNDFSNSLQSKLLNYC